MFKKLTVKEQVERERQRTLVEQNRRIEVEQELEKANEIIKQMNNANSSLLDFQEEVLQDIIFTIYE